VHAHITFLETFQGTQNVAMQVLKVPTWERVHTPHFGSVSQFHHLIC